MDVGKEKWWGKNLGGANAAQVPHRVALMETEEPQATKEVKEKMDEEEDKQMRHKFWEEAPAIRSLINPHDEMMQEITADQWEKEHVYGKADQEREYEAFIDTIRKTQQQAGKAVRGRIRPEEFSNNNGGRAVKTDEEKQEIEARFKKSIENQAIRVKKVGIRVRQLQRAEYHFCERFQGVLKKKRITLHQDVTVEPDPEAPEVEAEPKNGDAREAQIYGMPPRVAGFPHIVRAMVDTLDIKLTGYEGGILPSACPEDSTDNETASDSGDEERPYIRIGEDDARRQDEEEEPDASATKAEAG